MPGPTLDRETILQSMRDWPIGEQVALANAILADVHASAQPIAQPPAFPSAERRGIPSSNRLEPTDKEMVRILDEEWVKRWGTDDYPVVLAHEFVAGEGSFLLQLRVYLKWDKAAFTQLTQAMLTCCQAYDAHELRAAHIGEGAYQTPLPRWLAEGFWYVPTFVRDWTSHPAWKEYIESEQEYYDRAYERLDRLADWFFTGHCPSMNPAKTFAPM